MATRESARAESWRKRCSARGPWMRWAPGFLLVAGVALAAAGGCGPVAAPGSTLQVGQPTAVDSSTSVATPELGHIFVLGMENKEYGDIIGASRAPFINSLAQGYGSAAEYYAIRHPSLPNYLALASGSTQGMTTDCGDCSFDAPNLVDQLQSHQKSWKAYMEDIPGPCFNGESAGGIGPFGNLYVRRHNPWMYFRSISGDPSRCSSVVPLSQLQQDLQRGQVPDFVWISPNLRHDMHDGSIEEGDGWLSSFVPGILSSPAWQENGVLFLVWDEGTTSGGCCGGAVGGHTVALVIASHGKRGYRSRTQLTHYSVLRTIEEGWRLGLMGGAADPSTRSMAEFFR